MPVSRGSTILIRLVAVPSPVSSSHQCTAPFDASRRRHPATDTPPQLIQRSSTLTHPLPQDLSFFYCFSSLNLSISPTRSIYPRSPDNTRPPLFNAIQPCNRAGLVFFSYSIFYYKM
ncbi:hypothetical protein B0H15DRAFT_867410 [Mycena belliarum]|uniref:Uncharacterized protein n=1 Tax=Mycena belliarum TaxID=1033014 RepID=A0AAD6TRD9_9AGAR|nr:hypothetical protein B0H15DRAFT_867410 [Mycena belliae]